MRIDPGYSGCFEDNAYLMFHSCFPWMKRAEKTTFFMVCESQEITECRLSLK